MSRVELPRWWLDKAIPVLESSSVRQADVARDASRLAGRKSPWTSSAISRFISGDAGRTVALANAISASLQIPPPFFVAPTEKAAIEMLRIVNSEQAHIDATNQALSVADGVAANHIRSGIVDARKKHGVASSDNGDKSGRGVWARRTRKSRS